MVGEEGESGIFLVFLINISIMRPLLLLPIQYVATDGLMHRVINQIEGKANVMYSILYFPELLCDLTG